MRWLPVLDPHGAAGLRSSGVSEMPKSVIEPRVPNVLSGDSYSACAVVPGTSLCITAFSVARPPPLAHSN